MKERIAFLDYMRVIACLMVVMVHSCEFFFIDGSSIGIRSLDDGFWVSVFDSAFRCSVPLFVLISAYLLVPVAGSVKEFFKKRLTRVVIPFVIWSLLYAALPFLWEEMSANDVFDSLLHLAYNFNDASGHMWFVYMLIGLYLFMPVISPWLREAGKTSEQMFLLFWFISTFFPYIRSFVGDVYGECYWNEYNMLWYFSGFIGYVVLAHYIRFRLEWSANKKLLIGVLCYITGYVFTATIWYNRISTAVTLQELELSWRFCTPNVVLESFGVFLVIEALSSNKKDNSFIREMSNLSYGVYLIHIFALGFVYRLLGEYFSTPLTIVLVGLTTFIICFILTKAISFIPKSKYIIG